MKNNYTVEHDNNNDALGEDFTAASIHNYHSLNEVNIKYWYDSKLIKCYTNIVAIMKVKLTNVPLQDRLSRKLGNVPLINGCSAVTLDVKYYTHA